MIQRVNKSKRAAVADFVIKNPIGNDYMGLAFIQWEPGSIETFTTLTPEGRLQTFDSTWDCETALTQIIVNAYSQRYPPFPDEMECSL